MNDGELNGLTLAGAIRMIRQKEISASELRRAVLERIDRLNPEVRAFITVLRDQPIDETRPPLFGAPVSVKDLYDTKDIITTAGSKIYAQRVPEQDATTVTKLNQAGGVIVGKTNLHEFAFGVTSVNAHFGTARNPWDRERIAGGSSGGSAVAVALGMGLGSLGTDTGGSIRIPASLCGIVGLKPTYGRVSVKGIVPLSWSLDHAGPMTKTVEDAALLLQVIAGHDSEDGYTRNSPVPQYTEALTGTIRGMFIGIPRTYFYERLDGEVESAIRKALGTIEGMGARMVDVDLSTIPAHGPAWLQIASPEAYAYHEQHLKTHSSLYGPDVRTRIEAGSGMLSIDYVKAQRIRTAIRMDCKTALDVCDVLITPTVPIPAPRIDALDKPWMNSNPETPVAALGRFTRYFNLAGLPAISVPCGFTSKGLPIGMQIAGRAFDESSVLRVAHAYEQSERWFERRPPM